MSPTPTALIPEIPSDETAPVRTSKQTEESVSPCTLLLFDKLQSWFTEALDTTTANISSQLGDRLKNFERIADQHRQQLIARLETLEGVTPTVQMTAPSEMHPPDEAPSPQRCQMNQCMEQLGDRINTLTNAVTSLQQKTGADKPKKEAILQGLADPNRSRLLAGTIILAPRLLLLRARTRNIQART
jgi:uncharacterized coiled-coil protein SlyX